MKENLAYIKECLFDAPTEVKAAYNEVVKYFALGKGKGGHPRYATSTYEPTAKGKTSKTRYAVEGWLTKEDYKSDRRLYMNQTPKPSKSVVPGLFNTPEEAEKCMKELLAKHPEAKLWISKH